MKQSMLLVFSWKTMVAMKINISYFAKHSSGDKWRQKLDYISMILLALVTAVFRF